MVHIERTRGLSEAHWRPVADHAERLHLALSAADNSLAIGSAKELVEAVARVVLDVRGIPASPREEYEPVLNKAHIALERLPGRGDDLEPAVRAIASSARKIAIQLRSLRNTYGTGHGRSVSVVATDELRQISVDAALLWARWALVRLESVLDSGAAQLARDLRSGVSLRFGVFSGRLGALDLDSEPPSALYEVGFAVARRAVAGSVPAWREGVDPCCSGYRGKVRQLPSVYRTGVLEGLFFDDNGYLELKLFRVQDVIQRHPHGNEATRLLLRRSKATDLPPGTTLTEVAHYASSLRWTALFLKGWQYRRFREMAARFTLSEDEIAGLPDLVREQYFSEEDLESLRAERAALAAGR